MHVCPQPCLHQLTHYTLTNVNNCEPIYIAIVVACYRYTIGRCPALHLHSGAAQSWNVLPARPPAPNCTASMICTMIITLGVSLGCTSGTTTRLSQAGGGPAAWCVTFKAWHLRLLRLTRTARVADFPSIDLFSVLWAIVAAACHCHCTEKGLL
jgi:hypothetical protein